MNFTKLPNKGHSLNKGQRLSYQSVRYLESRLYIHASCVWCFRYYFSLPIIRIAFEVSDTESDEDESDEEDSDWSN